MATLLYRDTDSIFVNHTSTASFVFISADIYVHTSIARCTIGIQLPVTQLISLLLMRSADNSF